VNQRAVNVEENQSDHWRKRIEEYREDCERQYARPGWEVTSCGFDRDFTLPTPNDLR
jgi:hypothetical protein